MGKIYLQSFVNLTLKKDYATILITSYSENFYFIKRLCSIKEMPQ